MLVCAWPAALPVLPGDSISVNLGGIWIHNRFPKCVRYTGHWELQECSFCGLIHVLCYPFSFYVFIIFLNLFSEYLNVNKITSGLHLEKLVEAGIFSPQFSVSNRHEFGRALLNLSCSAFQTYCLFFLLPNTAPLVGTATRDFLSSLPCIAAFSSVDTVY